MLEHVVVHGNCIAAEYYHCDWTNHHDKDVRQFLSIRRCFIFRQPRAIHTRRFVAGALHRILPGCNSHIQAGDIIFCMVQPTDMYYVHLYEYETEDGCMKTCFVTGNTYDGRKKKRTVYCFREHVYGILTKTIRG